MSKANLEEEAFVKIQEYMVEQNRPYSATDVYTNLRQEFEKPLVLKVLESLVASGVLKRKLVGKQEIFYANQENFEPYDESANAAYDTKIHELSEKQTRLSLQYKELQNELEGLSCMETTQRLGELVKELEEKLDCMRAHIASLEASDNLAIGEEGKKALEMEEKFLKQLKQRKRIAINMLNAISESSVLKKSDLLDSIGVEVDPGEW